MKPLALWSKTKSQNLELFIPPPAQRNFSLVFPTKWGGLRGKGEEEERGRKKIKTTRWKRRSSGPAEGSSSCDFLGIALDSGFVYSAGLVKTIYRCEDFEKSANAKARKRGVLGGGILQERAQHSSMIFIHTNRNQYPPACGTWLVCGPGAQGCTGQDFQMFPIIPQP